MPSLSIDSRTYRRLALFAKGAEISIRAAATDAIDNWLDLAHDPRLAVVALRAIAVKAPNDLPIAVAGAVSCLPANVTYIDEIRNRSTRHKLAHSRRHGEAVSEKVSR